MRGLLEKPRRSSWSFGLLFRKVGGRERRGRGYSRTYLLPLVMGWTDSWSEETKRPLNGSGMTGDTVRGSRPPVPAPFGSLPNPLPEENEFRLPLQGLRLPSKCVPARPRGERVRNRFQQTNTEKPRPVPRPGRLVLHEGNEFPAAFLCPGPGVERVEPDDFCDFEFFHFHWCSPVLKGWGRPWPRSCLTWRC